MKAHRSCILSGVAPALCVSFVAFFVFEIFSQYVFEATFEVRFRDVTPAEAVAIEESAKRWKNLDEEPPIVVWREFSPGFEKQLDVGISAKVLDQGFTKISRMVSYIGPDGYNGKLEISRNPSPMGTLVAIILSIVLFFWVQRGPRLRVKFSDSSQTMRL